MNPSILSLASPEKGVTTFNRLASMLGILYADRAGMLSAVDELDCVQGTLLGLGIERSGVEINNGLLLRETDFGLKGEKLGKERIRRLGGGGGNCTD